MSLVMRDILLQILQHEYKPGSCTNNAQSFKYLSKARTANNALSKSLLETEKYRETEVYEKNPKKQHCILKLTSSGEFGK